MRVEVVTPQPATTVTPTETLPPHKPKTYDVSKFRFPHLYDPRTGKPYTGSDLTDAVLGSKPPTKMGEPNIDPSTGKPFVFKKGEVSDILRFMGN